MQFSCTHKVLQIVESNEKNRQQPQKSGFTPPIIGLHDIRRRLKSYL